MVQLREEGGRRGAWPAEPSSAVDSLHSDHQ